MPGLSSLHGSPAAQIAVLLRGDPSTVRRWITRFNASEAGGLSGRPRIGRLPGGSQVAGAARAMGGTADLTSIQDGCR
ncbi:helix-turn-helix domain-containing protein [Thermomonospora sp. CIF 1]|uniref:helix-turn-helix domain-containing protein n=1 Tax=Thermomonospora sp. CIF 1 TaxID=1916083 RepID=UPI000CAA67E0|nr:MAG: hypothetical protein BUE48_004450 [Thermomonospora sp. CIF 1]